MTTKLDVIVNFKIFGPTFGYYDTYKLVFSQDSLVITIGEVTAICTDVGKVDPKWSIKNFSDFVDAKCDFTPTIFKNATGQFWMEWRKGELTITKLKSELKCLEEHLT